LKLAIVVSKFNEEVTNGLLSGALEYLSEHGIQAKDVPTYYAPGAFEIPVIAKALALSGHIDGVICLGCVIKGETAHFEFISLGATIGLQEASLKTGVPITFGILTTYNDEQAEARSRENAENKGREAAAACIETAHILRTIRK